MLEDQRHFDFRTRVPNILDRVWIAVQHDSWADGTVVGVNLHRNSLKIEDAVIKVRVPECNVAIPVRMRDEGETWAWDCPL